MLARWIIWLIFVVLWTWGQFIPDPAEFVRRFLSGAAGDGEGDEGFRSSLLETILSPHFWDVLHVAGYFVLTVLSGWLRVTWRRRWLLLAFLSFHAFVTEYFQGFQPMRHSTWPDVGLNHLGIVLGLVVSRKWWLKPTGSGPWA